jgi:RHS repeat-associated protein
MGGQYEIKDGAAKKYYSIAGMMVAVNDGTGLQYLLTDHLGSTVAVTNASGTLTSQQRYLPFGAARTIPNSPILGTDFTFTGQRDLGDMGLMDYDARFYSQSLGRFLQPDTIIPNVSIPQTWNRYSYAINNPTKFTDPSGHFIETAFDILSIGMDIADIAQNGLNLANGAALVLDVASAIIPGVPALGGLILKAGKAAKAVDTAMDAAKIANKVDNVIDTAKMADRSATAFRTGEDGSKLPLVLRDAQSKIDNIVDKHFQNVNLTKPPKFDPDLDPNIYGRAKQDEYTKIGPLSIWRGNMQTAITIAHEELHHRIWNRKFPTFSSLRDLELYVETRAIRFAQMKGIR